MWRIFSLAFIIGLLAMPMAASAQYLIDDPSLDSLVIAALNNNPDIISAIERARAAEYMISPAGALPDPVTNVGFSGPLADSWVNEPMAMPSITIGLSQKLPFPGKLGAMRGAADNKARGQREALEMARQGLAANVRSAYYNLAYWISADDIVDNNILFVSQLEEVARERYKAGLGIQANVLRAQKTITRLEDQKLMIERMINTSQALLARLVGDPNLPDLPATLPEINRLQEFDRSNLLSRMFHQNPELKKSNFEIERRRRLLRKAKLDYIPDLTLGAVYGVRRENDMFPMFGRDMLTVKAGLSIPIWAKWKQKKIVSSARANLRSSEFAKSDIRNKLQFELDRNLLTYRRHRSRFDLYSESLIPQSQATLESSRAAYEAGKLEFLDVITAQLELFDAELELKRSLADALKSLAEIEMLTADAVPLN